ncbi:MAG: hypothetical protein H6632_09700 [Anaerolineales bacterium]|nr:hypothetical protein [Anaerolineales bacterium]
MSEEKDRYGYEALGGIPREMDAFKIGDVAHPQLTNKNPGQYVLVGVEPAWIEQAHQVEVIDEHGDPLQGVWVIFGFSSGKNLNGLKPRDNFWTNSPGDIRGNAQRTNRMGYAQHTTGPKTGETVWIWDVSTGKLELPSVIVHSLKWINTEAGGPFIHSGVKLTFQRRREDIEPRGPRLDRIDKTLKSLQTRIDQVLETQQGGENLQNLATQVAALAETLKQAEDDISFLKKHM